MGSHELRIEAINGAHGSLTYAFISSSPWGGECSNLTAHAGLIREFQIHTSIQTVYSASAAMYRNEVMDQ